jgi:hypothetical protein
MLVEGKGVPFLFQKSKEGGDLVDFINIEPFAVRDVEKVICYSGRV